MSRGWVFAAVGLVCAGFVAPASATIVYSYVTDTPIVSKPVSTAFTVNVYLQEARDVGDTSLLGTTPGNGEDGLFGAGAGMTRTGSVPSSPTLLTIGGVTGAPAFLGGNFGIGTNTATSITASESVSPNPGTAGAPTISAGTNTLRVLLFTFNLKTGSVSGETTSFSIAKVTPSGNTLTKTNGYDLDASNNGLLSGPPTYNGAIPGSFSVTTIPEPTSLLPLGLGLLAFRRNRRSA